MHALSHVDALNLISGAYHRSTLGMKGMDDADGSIEVVLSVARVCELTGAGRAGVCPTMGLG